MNKPDAELAQGCKNVLHTLYEQRKVTPIKYAEDNCREIDWWNKQLCQSMGWDK